MCPTCKQIINVPPNAPLFRCVCGQVFSLCFPSLLGSSSSRRHDSYYYCSHDCYHDCTVPAECYCAAEEVHLLRCRKEGCQKCRSCRRWRPFVKWSAGYWWSSSLSHEWQRRSFHPCTMSFFLHLYAFMRFLMNSI